MKAFAELYARLDASNKTSDKVAALTDYFRSAPAEDAVWALAVLTGRRPKRPFASTKLQLWAAELAEIPPWLFTECYDAVGDLAETIALLLPGRTGDDTPPGLGHVVESVLMPLADAEESTQRAVVTQTWLRLTTAERFVFNKLITGGFRVGVSKELVVRGLAAALGQPQAVIAHRLMGDWVPSAAFFHSLAAPNDAVDHSRPYPFCLAHPIEGPVESLGLPHDWMADWKWDGIRAQVIHRAGEMFVWSRGEELITDRFPEIRDLAQALPPGTVLDGEILVIRDGQVQPFAELQRRIGRKTVTRKLLQELPVGLIAFDLIEFGGEDQRSTPLRDRRARLAEIAMCTPGIPHLLVAEDLLANADTWETLSIRYAEARDRGVEGVMLKRADSAYEGGRRKGIWWKWKVAPMTIDAVVVYAQRGSGRRASLYSDYTFAVWNDAGELVPFAKAYSGLSDEEMRRVDAVVRRTTLEKFGPVRTVRPEMVMELAFEGIQRSSRHKSGVAVRFPRILRWRTDKRPEDANRLADVLALLDQITLGPVRAIDPESDEP
ncbi:MAG: ATP-dependent DNA ligase [Fimbriimonadaceae bacterium]|nr:ATP-dependent DNA ligase [Fimbriimonadaceae bacterium]